MKKSTIYFLVVSLLAFAGCQQDENRPINQTPSGPDNSKDVAYVQEHLGKLGESVLNLSPEPDFRSGLYSEISKKFDGDNNVLFKTLLESNKSNARVNSVLSTNAVQAALKAFENIDGENYYPQIFIPFYDELMEKDAIGVSQPPLIICTGYALSYEAYGLNSEGNLVQLGFLIDEEYAKNNEVWVLSINERVDKNGNVEEEFKVRDENRRVAEMANGKITTMKLTHHFDAFVQGASEINITVCGTWKNYINPASQLADVKEIHTERRMRDISRKEINKGVLVNANFPWWYYLDMTYYGNYCFYIIYEYDGYPAVKREAAVTADGWTFANYLEYRSEQSGIVSGYVKDGAFDFKKTYSNSGFEFTSVK